MDYSLLAAAYRQLEAAPARLKKVEIVAGLLAEAHTSILPQITNLLQGSVFPPWSPYKLGLAGNLTAKIIGTVTGYSGEDIDTLYNKEGDYGTVIETLLSKKKQRTLFGKKLTVEKVFENLQKVGAVEGKGAQERKFSLVAELLGSATPEEARYLIRTVMEELRTGVAEGVLRDAIAKAFFADVVWTDRSSEVVRSASSQRILMEKGLLEMLEKKEKISTKEREKFLEQNTVSQKPLEEIRQAEFWKAKGRLDTILLSDADTGCRLKQDILDAVEWAWFMRPDYGEVAAAAKSGGREALKEMTLEFGMPFHVQLAEKAPTLAEAIHSFDHIALEWKFDGARVQIHKKGKQVWLFTRRQEDITAQFPDVVSLVHKNVTASTAILEGEIVGVDKHGQPLPFQVLSQRVHRKYDIEKTAAEIPIQVNLFDIVFLEGKMLFSRPFSERRQLLQSAIQETDTFRLAKQLVTTDLQAAEKFYRQALDAKQEGLIVKNMDAPYQPGRRVAGGWLKVKPIMETLDLCITGGTWGTGKRTGWLGSLLLGCRDPDSGKFLECGMIGTGIKEKEESGGVTFDQLTDLLKPLIVSEKENTVTVKPRVVVEVAYEEIQKSTNYPSGFALRFPRVVRLRDDRSPADSDTLARLKAIYQQQFAKGK